MKLHPLNPLHAPILAELARRSFGDPWERPWNSEEFAEMLDNPSITGWLAEAHSFPQGFLLIAKAGDQADILSIAISPEMRRKGLGRALLKKMLDWGEEQNIDAFILEVAVLNAPAIAFYHAAGFCLSGERKAYYPSVQGAVDALLLKATIPSLRGALLPE